jgi:hypothetical protein
VTVDIDTRFLRALYPDLDGAFIELRVKRGKTMKASFHGCPDTLARTASTMAATHDVYLGIAARRDRSNGTKANLAWAIAVWSELDVGEGKPYPTLLEAYEAVRNFALRPSMIIESGRGLHIYWLLREAWPLENAADLEAFEAVTNGLAVALKGDAAWDASRVLRLPGTLWHKEEPARPVKLAKFNADLRYNLSDFEPWATPPRRGEPVDFTAGEDADAEDALRKAEAHGLPARSWRLITEGHPDGADRSKGDFAAACDLVRSGLSDDEIRAIFAHYPIGEKYREPDVGDRYLGLTIGKARAGDAPPAGKAPEAQCEALQRAKEIVAAWLLLDDPRVVDVILAVPVANSAPGDPVWLIIVAASSGAKTELLRGLSRCPQVFPLSALTDRTLASGWGDPAQTSLLPKLREGQTLTLKDFGSVLTMRPDAKSEVLGQLREVYDGSYRKAFGTGRELQWKGRLGLLTASTPAIERHHSVIGELGERFLTYRLDTPEDDREAIGDVALEDSGQECQMREEIAAAFLDVIGDIDPASVAAVSCPKEIKAILRDAANLATWLRTPVARDYRDKTIEYQPLPEGPARMAKALLRLGKALATVRGQDAIDAAVAGLLTKIALDSVPPKRLAAVRSLAREATWVTTRELGFAINLPTTSVTYLLEDLDALRIIDKRVQGGGDASTNRPFEWCLRDKIAALIVATGGAQANV